MSLEAEEGNTLQGDGSQVNLRSSRDWSEMAHTERTQLLRFNALRRSLAWMPVRGWNGFEFQCYARGLVASDRGQG